MSGEGREVAIALVHHPVLDAQKGIVTSTVTNLDVHDLARSARTFGCSSYFVVHPVDAQLALVERIREHWTVGSSAARIPTRKEALALLRPVRSLADVYATFGGRDAVTVWATAARATRETRAFEDARRELEVPGKPVVILFGTAWGLPAELLAEVDALLPPLGARPGRGDGYKHLSVRAACALTLDRLLGER
jgi:hypothetical protein